MVVPSLVATFVASLFAFALGAIWYGPLFGKIWMAENRLTVEDLRGRNFNPAKVYGATFVLGFIAAFVFGMFVGPNPAIEVAAGMGFAAGLAWVATSFATSYLFEGRSLRHWLINAGYYTVQYTLIGLAFGLLG